MDCYCGSKKEFQECCEPIINKTLQAQTPEELMRSRYSAYVTGNGEYLVFSAAKNNRYADDAKLIEEFCASVEWLKLNVLKSENDTVEFKAYYRDKNGIQVLYEKSDFIQEDRLWKYASGELYNAKVERNESCPCGSGKKYKKCCGK